MRASLRIRNLRFELRQAYRMYLKTISAAQITVAGAVVLNDTRRVGQWVHNGQSEVGENELTPEQREIIEGSSSTVVPSGKALAMAIAAGRTLSRRSLFGTRLVKKRHAALLARLPKGHEGSAFTQFVEGCGVAFETVPTKHKARRNTVVVYGDEAKSDRVIYKGDKSSGYLSSDEVLKHEALILNSDAVVLPLDQPYDAMHAAANKVREHKNSTIVVSTLAPATKGEASYSETQIRHMLDQSDVLILNADEARSVLIAAGIQVGEPGSGKNDELANVQDLAAKLAELVPRGVITCGGNPYVVGFDSDPNYESPVFTRQVKLSRKVIDPDGAGDAFLGACVAELTRLYLSGPAAERPADERPKWTREELRMAIGRGCATSRRQVQTPGPQLISRLRGKSSLKKHPGFRLFNPSPGGVSRRR